MMQTFKVGDRVKTIEGNKETGPFTGTIIKTGKKYKEYRAVIVRKDNADVSVRDVRVLEKNIVKIGTDEKITVSKAIDILLYIAFAFVISIAVWQYHVKYQVNPAKNIMEEAAHYSAYPTTIAAIERVQGDKFIGAAKSSERFLTLVLHHGYFKALYYYGGSWEFVAEVMNEKERISNE
jgi:hypothetical protein